MKKNSEIEGKMDTYFTYRRVLVGNGSIISPPEINKPETPFDRYLGLANISGHDVLIQRRETRQLTQRVTVTDYSIKLLTGVESIPGPQGRINLRRMVPDVDSATKFVERTGVPVVLKFSDKKIILTKKK